MMFRIMNLYWLQDRGQRTASGNPFWNPEFKDSGKAVHDLDESKAIELAKRLGFSNPILEKME